MFRYEIIEGEKVREITVGGRTREIFNDTIIGYDKKDREATRIAVMEPFYERDRKYPNSI